MEGTRHLGFGGFCFLMKAKNSELPSGKGGNSSSDNQTLWESRGPPAPHPFLAGGQALLGKHGSLHGKCGASLVLSLLKFKESWVEARSAWPSFFSMSLANNSSFLGWLPLFPFPKPWNNPEIPGETFSLPPEMLESLHHSEDSSSQPKIAWGVLQANPISVWIYLNAHPYH